MLLRVLHVFGQTSRGGAESMIMNYYRKIDRNEIQFDFVKHSELEGDFDEEIKSLGGRIFSVPRLTVFNYFSYIKTWKEFFSAHPEYRIVHVHHFKLAGAVLKAAKACGVKVRIAHSHSAFIKGRIHETILFLTVLSPMMKHYATHLWACGKEAGKVIFGRKKFTILNNAIDVDKFKFSETARANIRSEFSIGNDIKVVGHVGRFVTPKNHPRLIRIFRQLHAEDTKTCLLLVGDGDMRQEIEQLVQKTGLSDNVIFAGVRTDIPAMLSAMDIFLFPSLNEGLPVSIIEAEASGLPCVVSDSVTKEVNVTDLVTNIPLSASDKEWSKAVEKAIGRKNQRNRYPQIIKDAHYDISENAQWLTQEYIRMSKD